MKVDGRGRVRWTRYRIRFELTKKGLTAYVRHYSDNKDTERVVGAATIGWLVLDLLEDAQSRQQLCEALTLIDAPKRWPAIIIPKHMRAVQ